MSARARLVPLHERVERKRGRAGQRQRQRRLERTDGLCEHCLAKGKVTLATVVNHKVPLAHGGSDKDDNTENLCGPCDQVVTAEQFGHLAPPNQGVDGAGRPTNPDHPWNRAPKPAGAEPIASPPPGLKV